MKLFFWTSIFIIFLAGCFGSNGASIDQHELEVTYSPKQKIEDSVTITNNKIKNTDSLFDLINHFNNRKKYAIKVIKITSEGDPIYYFLEYDGEKIIYTIDSTRDEYGNQEIRTIKCHAFRKIESKDQIYFVLKQCGDENKQIKVVSLNNEF
ncbi:MAG TPA: DUF4362 domain-containing protein [Bacillales bacterium]